MTQLLRSIPIHTYLVALLSMCCMQNTLAACAPPTEKSRLAQVEANFCSADAVFTGNVDQVTKTDVFDENRNETYEARSKIKVLTNYKGINGDAAVMVTDLKASGGTFFFKDGKQYLIFARKVAPGEYVGETSSCAAQTSLETDQAAAILKRLDLHAQGAKPIDCEHGKKKTSSSKK
jgi:hypothetical protein